VSRSLDRHQKHLAALAASTLEFRRNAADALDTILVESIKHNSPITLGEFKSNTGRPCGLVFVVGDDATRMLQAASIKIAKALETTRP
jgi:hypothetical protein